MTVENDTSVVLTEIAPGLLVGPDLYKFDSKGKLRVWRMECEGNKHRTIAGLADGKLTVSGWTVCEGKQKRSDEEQAQFEVQSGYTYNLKREYFLTTEEAEGGARFFLPMLAEKWKDCKFSGALARLKKAGFVPKYEGHTGIYYQHKFDGFCCIAQASGLTSREGEPIVAVPHIMEALQPYFEKFPDGVLHGELYHHDLKDDFQTLSSILRKSKNITEEQYAFARANTQYHVYDNPAPHARDLVFSERFKVLLEDLHDLPTLGDVIHIADTVEVVDEPHINDLMADSLEKGYEGGIGRLDIGGYVQKRSWQVTKIKEFEDAEFEVAGIEEGKGNYMGYAKRATFWLPNADRSEGPNASNTFGAGIKGGLSQFNRDLLADPDSQKVATVRFTRWTDDGIPFQGVVHAWHGDRRTL